MNEYQQGFIHACRLMKHMFEKNKTPITKEFRKLLDFIDESELEAIKRGIGVQKNMIEIQIEKTLYNEIQETISRSDVTENTVDEFMINAVTKLINTY